MRAKIGAAQSRECTMRENGLCSEYLNRLRELRLSRSDSYVKSLGFKNESMNQGPHTKELLFVCTPTLAARAKVYEGREGTKALNKSRAL